MISTVAGSGTAGFSGDGGAATAALLNTPSGVALDGAGNLYISDGLNHRIRKVDSSGNISTVAGTGTQGYGGDGGAATAALLNTPADVALDGAGNLYIVDNNNHRIRKVDSAGNISTVAGTGTAGFSGDGGAAMAALLNHPVGVALDALGNLYIADQLNHRIRKIATVPGFSAGILSTGVITTVAGDGAQGYGGDGGAAVAAQLNLPVGVALDGAGNLYIADRSNNRIRKVGPPPPPPPPARPREPEPTVEPVGRFRVVVHAGGGSRPVGTDVADAHAARRRRRGGVRGADQRALDRGLALERERIVEGELGRGRDDYAAGYGESSGAASGNPPRLCVYPLRGGARRGCASCWRWRRRRVRT